MPNQPEIHERRIRSFVRRPGRLTPGQRRAFDDLWPKFGLDSNSGWDWPAVFGRQGAKRVLEIGYGDGDSLIELAAAHADIDFLGIEVHEPGIGHCLLEIERRQLENVRLIALDAVDVLKGIPPGSLDRLNLYFPDPWPKKRHHKRRIVNPVFLELASKALRSGGKLHIATDWAPYAEHITETLQADKHFELLQHQRHDGEQPLQRFTTKFERRGLRLGHRIDDWIFENTA